jgi:hypothetical protein
MKLPDYPRKGIPVEQTVDQIIDFLRASKITSFVGGKVRETPSGTTLALAERPDKKITDSQPPFYPNLYISGTDAFAMKMKDGYVILRKNATGSDAVASIKPTGIPDDLAVVAGDKFTLKIIEDPKGLFETAEVIKSSSWPTSTAPELEGGDIVGTDGERHIRLCEVIAEEGKTRVDIWSTGHVDHFQPCLIDNTYNSPSTNEARVLKEWDATEGKWKLRYLVGEDGIEIVENADSITIKPGAGGFGHPWKVTDAGSGSAAIAAGYVHGYYIYYSGAAAGVLPTGESAGSIVGPDRVVMGPSGSYGSGTAAITGTQYIYAEVTNSIGDEYSESYGGTADETILVEIYDYTPPSTQTVTIVVSSDGASTYAPTSGTVAICIAKVTNTAGTITVDDQYITHNPTMFIPISAVTVAAI